MADNLRKFTTQEVLNKVYTDSSGITIGLNSQSSKETLNAVLDSSNNRLQVAMAGGTISGDVTISGDLTVEGDGVLNISETIQGKLKVVEGAGTLPSGVGTTTGDLIIAQNNDTTTDIAAIYAIAGNAGSSHFVFGDTDSKNPGRVSYDHSDNSMDLVTNATVRMTITSAGLVSIGTDSPRVFTEIKGASTTNPANGTGGKQVLQVNDTTSYALGVGGGIGLGGVFHNNGSDTIFGEIRGIKENGTDGNYASALTFSTRENNASITERMRITSAGRVILNASPADHSAAPTLAFGDGDTGFYEDSDDVFRLAIAGQLRWTFGSTETTNSSNVRILTETSSATNPVFIANGSYDDGVGGAVNTVALITNSTAKLIVDDNSRISLSNNDSGDDNTILGYNAGRLLASGGDDNVIIGHEAVAGGTGSTGFGGTLNVFMGYRAGYNQEQATHRSVVIGANAGDASQGGYIDSVFIGYNSGGAVTTGDNNVAIGSGAGGGITTEANVVAIGFGSYATQDASNDAEGSSGHGSGNIAIGYQSMTTFNHDDFLRNTAIGFQTMSAGTSDAAQDNSAFGYRALQRVTTGTTNTAIGSYAMDATTTSSNNVAVGVSALGAAVDSCQSNVAVGVQASQSLTVGTNSGAGTNSVNGNVSLGYNAFGSASLGTFNDSTDRAISGNIAIGKNALDSTAGNPQTGTIAIGHEALTALTSGSKNTAIGYQAAMELENNNNNTVIGYNAMYRSGATVYYNTFIGAESGSGDWSGGAYSNTAVGASTMTGVMTAAAIDNVAIGRDTLTALTSGASNTAVGRGAGQTLTNAPNTTYIGKDAGKFATGANNVVVGAFAFDTSGNSGTHNVAIGTNAMSNSTGAVNHCVAIGEGALAGSLVATGDDPSGAVGVGYQAGVSVASAIGFTGLGYQAGYNNNGADKATFVGFRAGFSGAFNHNNTYVGYKTGYGASSGGEANSGLGVEALTNVNGAVGNVALGWKAGNIITSGDYNTLIGYDADVDAATDSYQVKIGSHGIIKYKTARVTLDNSYTGTPADGDAAHTNALFNIPSYSYIQKITVKVITLSANSDASFHICRSATLNTASGTALGTPVEILGADGSTSNWVLRSSGAQTAASNIDAGSGGVVNSTWISINKHANSSLGWIPDANSGTGHGIYVTHSGANTASDGGADAVLDIMVEYY